MAPTLPTMHLSHWVTFIYQITFSFLWSHRRLQIIFSHMQLCFPRPVNKLKCVKLVELPFNSKIQSDPVSKKQILSNWGFFIFISYTHLSHFPPQALCRFLNQFFLYILNWLTSREDVHNYQTQTTSSFYMILFLQTFHHQIALVASRTSRALHIC